MYFSTPIHPLLCEAGLIPASILLDYRQKIYTHRLLSLTDLHPTKEILPISLRKGDGSLQPGETRKHLSVDAKLAANIIRAVVSMANYR